MRNIRKRISIVLIIALYISIFSGIQFFHFASASASAKDVISVEGYERCPDVLRISKLGQTLHLYSNVANQVARWSTSNSDVVTVSSSGNLTSISSGEAVITLFAGDIKQTLSVEVVYYGDVNNDGDVDITDLTSVRECEVGMAVLSEQEFLRGDVDGDGEIAENDIDLIREHIQELRTDFPAEHMLRAIQVVSEPDKLVYKKSSKSEIDTTGLVVEAHYNNGSHKRISDYKVEGDIRQTGKSSVTIEYREEGRVCSTSYEILVEEVDYGLRNPRVKQLERECVYFGNYWQEDTNGDGKADQNDEKTPVKWQILSKDEESGTALLWADQVLEYRAYNNEKDNVTWENSEIRGWLNDEFMNNVFVSKEQEQILNTELINESENSTIDKLYLLSQDDVKNTVYGFNDDLTYYDQARSAKPTSYVMQKGIVTNADEKSEQWLRIQHSFDSLETLVHSSVHASLIKDNHKHGVRPALRINLSVLDSLGELEAEDIALLGSQWDTIVFGKYKGTPITWRVLNIKGDDAFLLSDKLLENAQYDGAHVSSDWEKSTIRKWLNNDFFMTTFSEEERAAMKTEKVVNEGNTYYGVDGGNDTEDKIFLLSLSEIKNINYGFPSNWMVNSNMRKAGLLGDEEGKGQNQWLRTLGEYGSCGAAVSDKGYVLVYGTSIRDNYGVRPAIHINLSDTSLWEKGEVIESGDTEGATIPVVSTPIPEIPEVIETMSPESTEEPEATLVPDNTVEPEETSESTPTVSICPTEIPTTVPTEIPEYTMLPEITVEPVASELPSSTEGTVSTKEPEPTEPPAVSEEPTVTPVVNEEPTVTPVVNEEPTASPVVNEEPTVSPVISARPTAVPVSSKEPETTSTPVLPPILSIPTQSPSSTSSPEPSIEEVGKQGEQAVETPAPVSTSQFKKGSTFYSGNVKYKVLGITQKTGTLSVVGTKNKKLKKVVLPTSVYKKGIRFKIISIGANAFKNCKKLSVVNIESKDIKTIGKKAFRGIAKKVKFLVSKSVIKKYSKMIKKAK